MKFGKITATVFMAIAATGITAATAHGESAAVTEQPAAVTAGDATSGVDRGINYQTAVSPVDKTVTTTVANGRFELAPSGTAVALKSDTGETMGEVPLQFDVEGVSIAAAQQIGADGHTLTLTPTPTAEDIAQLKDISSFDRLLEQINKNQPNVTIGAVIGGIIGAFVPFLWIFTIPAGVVIGGIIGGYSQGGQEFLDAVQAFATGQP
ncbi:hypothetical protein [Nocardia sp. BMG51109]|uniref:hypothetical protein n=1 Tax=Nocardia sp. BMG51109 TaxID=1056816 RepID=UPI0004634A96|nr:hypothetical protein [Nocardia sp. BMG51109]